MNTIRALVMFTGIVLYWAIRQTCRWIANREWWK